MLFVVSLCALIMCHQMHLYRNDRVKRTMAVQNCQKNCVWGGGLPHSYLFLCSQMNHYAAMNTW
jgi:hypothetical protein